MILGKDPYHSCVTRADLVFANGHLSIVTCDEEGIIRIYAYDPHGVYTLVFSITGTHRYADPESKSGQHLLCRTEFHGQMEYRNSLLVAHRPKNGDLEIPQARLICGMQYIFV